MDFVEVTAEHLAKGVAMSSARCPIALALIDHGERVRVFQTETEVFDAGDRIAFKLNHSGALRSWIQAYDHNGGEHHNGGEFPPIRLGIDWGTRTMVLA